MILILGLLALLFGRDYTLLRVIPLQIVGLMLVGLGIVEFYVRRAFYLKLLGIEGRGLPRDQRAINPVAHELASLGAPEGFVVWAASQESTIWERCNHGKWVMWIAGRTADEEKKRRNVVAAAVACARTAISLIPAQKAAPLRKTLKTAENWVAGKATLADFEGTEASDAVRALMWEGDRAQHKRAAEAAQAAAYCKRLAAAAAKFDPDPEFKARVAEEVANAAPERKELVLALNSPGSLQTFAEWAVDVVQSAVMARIWEAEIRANEARADTLAKKLSEARSAELGAVIAGVGDSESKAEAAIRYQSAQEGLSGQRLSAAGEEAAGKASLECADIIRLHVQKPAIFE